VILENSMVVRDTRNRLAKREPSPICMKINAKQKGLFSLLVKTE
jgi:hypothetical protein